jgi:hypothetical protein
MDQETLFDAGSQQEAKALPSRLDITRIAHTLALAGSA